MAVRRRQAENHPGSREIAQLAVLTQFPRHAADLQRGQNGMPVIGRAIRYKSHAHLPENQRRVRVMRYYSTLPKPLFGKGDAGIERYMQAAAKQKGELGAQIMDALQEASDKGPLPPPPPAVQKTAARYGFNPALLCQLRAQVLEHRAAHVVA